MVLGSVSLLQLPLDLELKGFEEFFGRLIVLEKSLKVLLVLFDVRIDLELDVVEVYRDIRVGTFGQFYCYNAVVFNFKLQLNQHF